jgi:hypothetical protein
MRNHHSFDETEQDVILTVRTLCPEKWLLVDRETGQVYTGNPGGYWDKMEKKTRTIDNDLGQK